MTSTTSDYGKKPAKLVIWLMVVPLLVGTAWLILRPAKDTNHPSADEAAPIASEPERVAGESDPAGGVDSNPSVEAPAPPTEGGQFAATLPPFIDLSETYDSEEFYHVPEWLPRPSQAIAASAEDAGTMSTGYQEGTVRYTLAGSTPDWSEWLNGKLLEAGLRPGENPMVYNSESPPREVAVEIVSSASGQITLVMKYEAIDHEKSCACTTCAGQTQ